MIAKHVQGDKKTSSAARLVRYIVNAKGGIDPRSWKQTADYILDLGKSDTNEFGEKVGGVRVSNCGTDDPAAATLLIEMTQKFNTRSKAEKTYHLVFSFPSGEQPPLEVLHAIEDELCASIGYADHQRISAVHIDTDNLHVHVAINQIHPTGFQNIQPYQDMPRLMEACERLEIKYGLERDNHGLDQRTKNNERRIKRRNDELRLGPAQRPDERDSLFRRYLCQSYNLAISERPAAQTLNGLRNLSSCHMARASEGTAVLLPDDARAGVEQSGEEPADGLRRAGNGARTDAGSAVTGLSARIRDIERQGLQETLAGYVGRELGESFSKVQSWSQLHEKAGEHGLTIKLRGAGLVIGDEGLDMWTKASSVDRNLSLGALTRKLGAFEAWGKGGDNDKPTAAGLSDEPAKPGNPKLRYQPKPLSKHPSSAKLFERYQSERAQMAVRRTNGFAAIKQESEHLRQKLKQWNIAQRMVLKVTTRGASKKIAQTLIRHQYMAAHQTNRTALAAKRQQLFEDTRLPSWADWLLIQARRGNAEALLILQERQKRCDRGGDTLTAAIPGIARQLVRPDLNPRIDSQGNVTYRASDGGIVVDRGKLVHAKSNSTNTALMALEIASRKFDGQPLVVEGTDQFKQDVAALARKYKFDVRFADPEMESARVAADIAKSAKLKRIEFTSLQREEGTGMEVVDADTASPLSTWVASRNAHLGKVQNILPHRLWKPTDAGSCIYQGKRKVEGGQEILLLQKGTEMLVMPASAQVVAKISRLRIGQAVKLDPRGRFVSANEIERE